MRRDLELPPLISNSRSVLGNRSGFYGGRWDNGRRSSDPQITFLHVRRHLSTKDGTKMRWKSGCAASHPEIHPVTSSTWTHLVIILIPFMEYDGIRGPSATTPDPDLNEGPQTS